MTKADAVQAGLAAIQAGMSDALGGCFDAGVASVPTVPEGDGGFTQEQMDLAVSLAVAQLNDQLAQVQAALTAETATEQGEAAQLAAANAKIDQIRILLGM